MTLDMMRVVWIFMFGMALGMSTIIISMLLFKDITLKEIVTGYLMFIGLIFIVGLYFGII